MSILPNLCMHRLMSSLSMIQIKKQQKINTILQENGHTLSKKNAVVPKHTLLCNAFIILTMVNILEEIPISNSIYVCRSENNSLWEYFPHQLVTFPLQNKYNAHHFRAIFTIQWNFCIMQLSCWNRCWHRMKYTQIEYAQPKSQDEYCCDICETMNEWSTMK